MWDIKTSILWKSIKSTNNKLLTSARIFRRIRPYHGRVYFFHDFTNMTLIFIIIITFVGFIGVSMLFDNIISELCTQSFCASDYTKSISKNGPLGVLSAILYRTRDVKLIDNPLSLLLIRGAIRNLPLSASPIGPGSEYYFNFTLACSMGSKAKLILISVKHFNRPIIALFMLV